MRGHLAAMRDMLAIAPPDWHLSQGVFQGAEHALFHLDDDCFVLGVPRAPRSIESILESFDEGDTFTVCDRCLSNDRPEDPLETMGTKVSLKALLITYKFVYGLRSLDAGGAPSSAKHTVAYARGLVDAGRAFTDDTFDGYLESHQLRWYTAVGVDFEQLHKNAWTSGKAMFDRLVAARHVTAQVDPPARAPDRLAVFAKGSDFWPDLGLRRLPQEEVLWYARALEAPRRADIRDGFLAEVPAPPEDAQVAADLTFVPPPVANPQAYAAALEMWNTDNLDDLCTMLVASDAAYL